MKFSIPSMASSPPSFRPHTSVNLALGSFSFYVNGNALPTCIAFGLTKTPPILLRHRSFCKIHLVHLQFLRPKYKALYLSLINVIL